LALAVGAVACGLDLSGTLEAITGSAEAGVDATTDTGGGVPLTDAGGDASSEAGEDAEVDGHEAGPPPCTEANAKELGGHCYIPLGSVTTAYTWEQAKAACEALVPPAHLATLASQAEQTLVRGLGTGERFIGMRREEDAGALDRASFKWITGEAVGYQNWKSDEPNGSIAPALCVRLLEDGQWADGPCDPQIDLWAVCERE
jgi:hypothetical protein